MNNRTEDARQKPECARADDLIAYLYGEVTKAEAKNFESHINACAVCREEFVAFNHVREAVGEWRAEALRNAPTLAFAESFATTEQAVSQTAKSERRSALAALREFFSLSPLWLQTATVTATLLICALAALTFARTEIRWDQNGLALQMGVSERVVDRRVEVPVETGIAQTQLDELAAQHAREVDELRNQLKQKEASLAAAASEISSLKATPRIEAASVKKGGRTKGQQNYSALAAQSNDELPENITEEPPRLYDLLRDVN